MTTPYDFRLHEKIGEIFRVVFSGVNFWRFFKPQQNEGLKLIVVQTYSTVTDLARFLGWSISVPLKRATSYESI
jgi:hypothetical protein